MMMGLMDRRVPGRVGRIAALGADKCQKYGGAMTGPSNLSQSDMNFNM